MQTSTAYRGSAMHPGLGGRAPAGSLTVSTGEVRFEAGDVYVQMPLVGLQVQAGGHNNEQFMLQHESRPGWLLTTSNPQFLDELLERGDRALCRQIGMARKQKVVLTKFYVLAAVLLAVIGGAIISLFLLKSTLARAVADRLPVSWEQQFGDSAMESVRKQMKIIDDPKWAAQLEVVKAKLLPVATNNSYPVKIYVADAKELNAFAMPGGHIVVFTGLLKAVDRPEELAGVLAHEIAHVNERHVLRKLIENVGIVLVIQALFGDTSGLLAVATQGSEVLLQQKFSRDFEREADDVGWNYLVAAGIDPRGMIDFFSKLQKDVANSSAEGQLSLLATHPPTAERISRLEDKWKAIANKAKFPALGAN